MYVIHLGNRNDRTRQPRREETALDNLDPTRETSALDHLQRQIRRLFGVVLILGLSAVALAALHVWSHHQSPDGDHSPLPLFQRAIQDAATATSDDISYGLRAIRSDNEQLIWRQGPDAEKRWLKVILWMSENAFQSYYADLVGKPGGGTTPTDQPILWVTLAPEVLEFCKGLNVPDPTFRIKQFLGLDPNRRYERFVELWVQAEDLFRPCPDPETDDSTCQLQFTAGDTPRVKNIADYPAYFEHLKSTQYQRGGAPWTRLGYTYDWAYGTRGFGASEFVVVPDARYLVTASATTAEYCSE